MKYVKLPKMAETIQTLQTPSPGLLLRLDRRDVAGLIWLKDRARFWITGLKRRRMRLPRCDYSPEEMALFQPVLALEEAAGSLLELTTPRQGVEAGGTPDRHLTGPERAKAKGSPYDHPRAT
jgi:hypothetical protein